MDELNLIALTKDRPIPLGLAVRMHVPLTLNVRSVEDTSLCEAYATEPAMMMCQQLNVFNLTELQRLSVLLEGKVAAATGRAREGVEGTESVDEGALLESD